jgi:hypothetical protein
MKNSLLTTLFAAILVAGGCDDAADTDVDDNGVEVDAGQIDTGVEMDLDADGTVVDDSTDDTAAEGANGDTDVGGAAVEEQPVETIPPALQEEE